MKMMRNDEVKHLKKKKNMKEELLSEQRKLLENLMDHKKLGRKRNLAKVRNSHRVLGHHEEI